MGANPMRVPLMQSPPARRGYDEITTPDSGGASARRQFGVRRRRFGSSEHGGADSGGNNRGETMAFTLAKGRATRASLSRSPVFEFGDPVVQEHEATASGRHQSGQAGQNAPKYQKPQRIEPGASIMQNEEEQRLLKLAPPPRESSGYISVIDNLKKRQPTPRMTATPPPPSPMRRPARSLEAASAPTRCPVTDLASPQPNGPMGRSEREQLPRATWIAPKRMTRDEAVSASRTKRPRLDLTPQKSGGIETRTSSRLQKSRSPQYSAMQVTSDEPSNATVARRYSTRQVREDSVTPSSFPLRRSRRNSKEPTEGSKAMPISLDDSDSNEDDSTDEVGKGHVEMFEDDDSDVTAVQKDVMSELKGLCAWFGHRTCRLDLAFGDKSLWITSIRGVGRDWTLDRRFKVQYDKVMEVMIYRFDSTIVHPPKSTDPAQLVMTSRSFIALRVNIGDGMNKSTWREFYDPLSDESESIDSKRYCIVVSQDDDKDALEFGVIEDILRGKNVNVHLLKTLDEVRPFARTMTSRDEHGVFKSQQTSRTTRDRRKGLAEDDADLTQLTYPLPPCSVDVVTITRLDVARLKPAQYLNDNIIDYYLKRLLLEDFAKNEFLKKNVLFLSSHFYSLLRAGRGTTPKERLEAGYRNVSTWLTKSDLFNRCLVFIPINKDMHWSLAVIINPKCAGLDTKMDDKDSISRTCIALLDPLGSYHRKAPIQRHLKAFLEFEWARVKDCASGSSIQQYQSAEIRCIDVKAPLQENSFDCGVFVLKYAQEMLSNFAEILDHIDHHDSTFLLPPDITEDGMRALIPIDAFGSDDITEKRKEIMALLAEDTKRYEALMSG